MSRTPKGAWTEWAWQQPVGLAKIVLLALVDRANPKDNGRCWPSVADIAKRVDQDPSSVRRHLGTLVDEKLIIREHRHNAEGHRTTDRITLCLPLNLHAGPSAQSTSPSAQSTSPSAQIEQGNSKRTVHEPRGASDAAPQASPPAPEKQPRRWVALPAYGPEIMFCQDHERRFTGTCPNCDQGLPATTRVIKPGEESETAPHRIKIEDTCPTHNMALPCPACADETRERCKPHRVTLPCPYCEESATEEGAGNSRVALDPPSSTADLGLKPQPKRRPASSRYRVDDAARRETERACDEAAAKLLAAFPETAASPNGRAS